MARSARIGEIDAARRAGMIAAARAQPERAERRGTRPRLAFSEFPDSSSEQLIAMRRVGRPPLGRDPVRLISIRVDLDVPEPPVAIRTCAAGLRIEGDTSFKLYRLTYNAWRYSLEIA